MGHRRRTPLWLHLAVAAGTAWLLFWPTLWLELELNDDGRRCTRRLPAKADEPFAVRFIHSVELHPVNEYFVLDRKGDVVLTGTRYYGFGAGLPTDGGEGVFSTDGDAFVIRDLHRPIGQLHIRLHPMNEYTVLHRGREYTWPEAEAGARLTVRGIRSGRLAVWLAGAIERRR